MQLEVVGLRRTDRFDSDIRKAPDEVASAAQQALERLLAHSRSKSLRLKALQGYGKPTIYKIDVRTDHSWQITFEMDGQEAVLLRLGTHKEIDRDPR